MRWETRAGTPNHMKAKRHETEAPVRNWLVSEMRPHLKFAGKFNLALDEQLKNIKIDITQNLVVSGMKCGEVREWVATDDVTGVQFTYQIERVE